MELYDDVEQDNKKNSKLSKIIIAIIIILAIIIIGIIGTIIYIRSSIMQITLNGENSTKLEEILLIEQDSNGVDKCYIPIKKIAPLLNYEAFNGDYIYKSEDLTKCYVQNSGEVAIYSLDSNIIAKTTNGIDYEYIEIDENVFEKDGELYTTVEGIRKGFNAQFTYNEKNKRISIYTMDYLINYYMSNLIKSKNIKEYSTDINDKKAIFENMLIIKVNDKYAVIDAKTGEYILEAKYDEIKYIPTTNNFMVKSNNKYGIVEKDTSIKINIAYDEIKLIDTRRILYLVKQNGLYGLLGEQGNNILAVDYEEIGLSTNAFKENGVENNYIILNELIPVKSNNLWGFFDLEGNKKIDFKYATLGCETSKVANSYPVLIIPNHNIIVIGNEKMFNLMTREGKEIVSGGFLLDSVYMRINTTTGERSYFMTYNGNTENIENRLSALGI